MFEESLPFSELANKGQGTNVIIAPSVSLILFASHFVYINHLKGSKMDVSLKGRGRSSPNELPVNGTTCLCDRPRCLVLCRNCGFGIKGRVSYSCPVHPQTVFLFDMTQCHRCRAYESFLCEFRDQEENA